MKLILYQATIAITKIDFGPGPFRCQIELGHLDFAVAETRFFNYCRFHIDYGNLGRTLGPVFARSELPRIPTLLRILKSQILAMKEASFCQN